MPKKTKFDFFLPTVWKMRHQSQPQWAEVELFDFLAANLDPARSPHGFQLMQVITTKQVPDWVERTLGLGFSIDTVGGARVIATCEHCLHYENAQVYDESSQELEIGQIILPQNAWTQNDLAFIIVDWKSQPNQSPQIANVLQEWDLAGMYWTNKIGGAELKTTWVFESGIVMPIDNDKLRLFPREKGVWMSGEQGCLAKYWVLEGMWWGQWSSGSPVFTNNGVAGMVFSVVPQKHHGFTLYLSIDHIMDTYEQEIRHQIK